VKAQNSTIGYGNNRLDSNRLSITQKIQMLHPYCSLQCYFIGHVMQRQELRKYGNQTAIVMTVLQAD